MSLGAGRSLGVQVWIFAGKFPLRGSPRGIFPQALAPQKAPQKEQSCSLPKDFFFWFGIHTASVPSTAGTSTGGDAVLGKPESSPARRHSRNSCHMFVCIVVCACSRHALDFEILLFRSFVTRKGYCMATSRRSESILLRDCVCCIVLLTRFWGIVTVPGSSLFRGPVT